jgi:hypothetical protein
MPRLEDMLILGELAEIRGRKPMASKGQMTGMLGVYLAAAELTQKGFIVSL